MTYFELFVKGAAVAAALVSALFLAGGLYGWWRFNLSKDAERLQRKLRGPGRIRTRGADVAGANGSGCGGRSVWSVRRGKTSVQTATPVQLRAGSGRHRRDAAGIILFQILNAS